MAKGKHVCRILVVIKAILSLNHNYNSTTPQNITSYSQNQICSNRANDDDISQRSNTIHPNHNVNTKIKWQATKKFGSTEKGGKKWSKKESL